MAIQVTCGSCGKQYQVAEQFAGKKAKCKACGGPMTVPQAAPVPAGAGAAAGATAEYDFGAMANMESGAAVDEAQAPWAPPPPVVETVGTVAALPRQTAYVPRPVEPVSRPAFRLGFRLNRPILALIIGGCVLGFFGIQEARLASAASPIPQQISCGQLERNGPGNNAHVKVTGFTVHGNYIYLPKAGQPDDWVRAWVPIIALDGDYAKRLAMQALVGGADAAKAMAKPSQVTVLVKSDRLHSREDVHAFALRGQVTGMVVNKIESLKSEEQAKLRNAYPATDFSKCYIIEDGREPAPPMRYMLMLGGGAALALLGLFLMLKPE